MGPRAVVANTAAAATVAELARQLTKLQRQHLQVMLDVTGHEILTDFVRISVYNTSNPFASVPVDGPDPAALRAARRLRGRSSGRGAATDVPKSLELRRRSPLEEFLRFAGYLPQENALVQQAYSLYLNRLPTEQSGTCSEGGSPSGPSMPQRTGAQSASQPGAQATGFELQGPRWRQSGAVVCPANPPLPCAGCCTPYRMAVGLLPVCLTVAACLAPWCRVDVDKRWRSLNHHTQQDELLNPITVLDPIPLYVNSSARLVQWPTPLQWFRLSRLACRQHRCTPYDSHQTLGQFGSKEPDGGRAWSGPSSSSGHTLHNEKAFVVNSRRDKA
ncbi:hypothetical protein V8C86DRAFT_3026601 [Haematococcus lacustris]